jgi:2-polyprenyl-3-methyl-5-hydroxy-6-metoxy-1,4-benzoquinol methylase
MQEKTALKWKLSQWLEYKWWKSYLKHKDVEQYLNSKCNYWNKILDTISPYLPLLKDQKILDAGCGPAGIFMVAQGNEVVALDPLLDKYKTLAHFKPSLFPWTKFKKGNIEAKEEINHYDVIFCMNAINHVNDIHLCYQKLAQVLKPGGHLIISTDAHRHKFLKKIFQFIPGDALHPIQLDITEYLNLLNIHEFNITKNVLYKEGNIFHYYITIATKN